MLCSTVIKEMKGKRNPRESIASLNCYFPCSSNDTARSLCIYIVIGVIALDDIIIVYFHCIDEALLYDVAIVWHKLGVPLQNIK